MSPFSERLRALQLRYGVRQKDLVEAMGFEQSYVSALELGINGPPSRDFVDRLARYLRLSADELAGLLSELEASRRHYGPASLPVCHPPRPQHGRVGIFSNRIGLYEQVTTPARSGPVGLTG
ncbi:helix-turn-helix domain-containing protein [Burkholderia gladioli]|uniref:helix-turn-helix domain-containing protein n=1 Tax=Burkholderia gladioli TaxID=28095 RepID=UPI001640A1F3|nr:helix-turn-helix domain-containing protein [Burkholderia gladioli]